jgi:hypothetical protein
MRKKVSDDFLDTEFEYVSGISLIHTFRVALYYMKAQAHICESLGACRR